jgi:adenylate cyclase
VEVHAQVCEQALLQRFLMRPDWGDYVEFFGFLVLGLTLIALMPRLGAAWGALLAGTTLVLAFGGSWWAYRAKGLLLDPVTPGIVILLIYLLTSLINFLRSEAQKKYFRGAFSRYISPALVEQLAKDPKRLRLGGETRELTFMFSDIRGFTTISEQFDAAGLTQFINRYLTPMTDIVLRNQGTIDKYMGDCIMAFWNAPLENPGHALDACRAGLQMRRDLVELNREWEAEAKAEGRKYIPIRAGIGVNTGPACVGNMGSDQRFDYSVLGDDVNLASRLEGQSKNYGVDFVIGPKTREYVKDFAALELDLIRVKGKTVPVHIYTLAGDEETAKTPEFQALAPKHAALIAAYRAQKWDETERLIAECRTAPFHLEKFYDMYLARIAAWRAEPPAQDWDGTFTATSK